MKPHALKKQVLLLSLLGAACVAVPGCSTPKAAKLPAKVQVSSAPSPSISPEAIAHVDNSTPLVYYSQSNPQWRSYLYGGSDPMSVYGCGPTVLAMAVSTLTQNPLTPPKAADWAASNGYWSKGHGSVHGIVPAGANAFHVKAESLNIHTEKSVKLALSYHKLLVFLMGPGDFTTSGHFILVYGINEDGTLKVADPSSEERSARSWPIDTLINQISSSTDYAGPIWALSALPTS